LFLFLSQQAPAKDLDFLTRYLVPIFLSQDFSAICREKEPGFLKQLPNGAGSIDDFSDKMKHEVTAGLSDDEAATVVLSAADIAIQAARDTLRKLNLDAPGLSAGRLNQWCATAAKPYVLNVVTRDQERHSTLLAILHKAKQ